MTYLAGRGLVHRDIAARNVLVADDFTCKVSDFGLSRQLATGGASGDYYKSAKGTAIPVRWTAPEALMERKYTEKSDVWAFGVLMYEVFTAAATPYEGMTNEMVLVRVKGGYRLPCPPECPASVFTNVVAPCWGAAVGQRPTFHALAKTLNAAKGSGDAHKNLAMVIAVSQDTKQNKPEVLARSKASLSASPPHNDYVDLIASDGPKLVSAVSAAPVGNIGGDGGDYLEVDEEVSGV